MLKSDSLCPQCTIRRKTSNIFRQVMSSKCRAVPQQRQGHWANCISQMYEPAAHSAGNPDRQAIYETDTRCYNKINPVDPGEVGMDAGASDVQTELLALIWQLPTGS
jgi:hypothetical protein